MGDIGLNSPMVLFISWCPDTDPQEDEESDSNFTPAGTPTSQPVNAAQLDPRPETVDDSGDDFVSLPVIDVLDDEGMCLGILLPLHKIRLRIIHVRRPFIVEDMLKVFRNNVTGMVKVDIAGENAVDSGGVFRDVLSEFWEKCFQKHFEGEDECVLVPSPQLSPDDFSTIGKILLVGYEQQGFFPIRFSRVLLICAMFSRDLVSNDLLLESFFRTLSNFERDSLENALLLVNLEGDILDDIIDILSRFRVTTIPKCRESLRLCLVRVAEIQLIENHAFSLQQMLPHMEKLKLFSDFQTVSAILALYIRLKPTGRKVTNILKAAPKNVTEQRVLDFLKRFIRSMSDDLLTAFLRYCTGSNVLHVDAIEVSFVHLSGLGRRFVAHTCGALLEVPVSYSSFNEFAGEFRTQLLGGQWDMQIL
ncbi:PREDICTED: uncharacterized protein LOC106811638 [Priapulus caudatus]|uniref:Uncharacterized protein LOC106811638 n=1 Tax=Priapulus caudatus TaxID=37621 RepID=A0ABM1EF54_PRICU|nr:PREDICTED: uncharacterized protein LOC106811638 [Priapulus caudatus]